VGGSRAGPAGLGRGLVVVVDTMAFLSSVINID
jgi:hypothetical protein